MSLPNLVPLEIELDRGLGLQIRWADGVSACVALADLRRACPCATCRTEREQAGRSTLPLARNSSVQQEMARVAAIEPVGNYAVRITWGDGHRTGIYDFELLRHLGERAGGGCQ